MNRLFALLSLTLSCLAIACGPGALEDPVEPPEDAEPRPLDEQPDTPPRTDTPDMEAPRDQGTTTPTPDMQDMGNDTPDQDLPEEEEDMPPVTPPGCDGDPACIDSFPHTITDSTTGAQNTWSRYACAPGTDEGGPEKVYRIILNEAGFVSAQLDQGLDGVDIDLHLLVEQDADTCLDRGHLATGAWLESGEYWLAADSWVDAEGTAYPGDFTLTINVTRAADLIAHGVPSQLAPDALLAFSNAWARQDTKRLEYAITDFSIHSSNPRTWVLDLSRDERLFLLTIGHGKGSVTGDDLGSATQFSNTPASHMSSLGMLRASETYTGDFGYSLRLDGLEPGFNDNARDRAIVVHPDERNRPEVTAQQGWLTPSRGCPTLDPATSAQVIDTLSDGALMFFWYPDDAWRQNSELLK